MTLRRAVQARENDYGRDQAGDRRVGISCLGVMSGSSETRRDCGALFWRHFRMSLHHLGTDPGLGPRPNLAKDASTKQNRYANPEKSRLGQTADHLRSPFDCIRSHSLNVIRPIQLSCAGDFSARPILILSRVQSTCFHQMPVHSGTMVLPRASTAFVNSSPKKSRINSSASCSEAN